MSEYDLVEEYLKYGEDFNLTADDKNPYYIHEMSDTKLLKEYYLTLETEKLHWKDKWLFIFNDAYLKRRIGKIMKIKSKINT